MALDDSQTLSNGLSVPIDGPQESMPVVPEDPFGTMIDMSSDEIDWVSISIKLCLLWAFIRSDFELPSYRIILIIMSSQRLISMRHGQILVQGSVTRRTLNLGI